MRRRMALSAALLICACGLRAADWLPVPPEDLALKAGRVDPKADAEVLVWHISVLNQFQGDRPETIYKNYVRLKVFTDRGAKNFEAPNIEYARGQNVSEVAARVIHPNGEIQELGKDAIFDRVLDKKRGRNDRAVSFAVPGAQAGSIIEYRWRETHEEELASNVILPAAREIPVERVVYHVKPLVSQWFPYAMRYTAYNVARPEFKPETKDVFVAELTNIPAYVEEEDAPPDLDIRPWLLVFYAPENNEKPDQFWKKQAKDLNATYKPEIKVNGDAKSLAASIIEGAASPDEQVARLARYCQKNLRNVSGPDVSDVDRKKSKENHTTADTLKRGMGTGVDIQLAFLALARAAGFDAALAEVSDREFKTFTVGLMNRMFLPYLDVAVNVNGKWKLYDVTSKYLAPGTLRWQEEGVPALIADDKEPVWVMPPITDAALSKIARTGTVTLDEEGSIEGEMTELRTGHWANEWRFNNMERSVSERQEVFRKHVQSYFPGAQVTEIQMPDPSEVEKPLAFRFHIKMEGYATRTGKRVIFVPALFEANREARYTGAERHSDILFHYAWSESDDYTINTPDGFALDHAEAPAPLKFMPVGQYSVKISATKKSVIYHRELFFGNEGRISMPQKAYPMLKNLFDTVHQRDTSLLTLKAVSGTPVAEAKQ